MSGERICILDRKIREYESVYALFNESVVLTFVNTFSYYKLLDSNCLLDKIDSIYIDGALQVFLHNIFFRRKVTRTSFDFSSIADDVFSYSLKQGCRMALVGATKEEAGLAVANLRNRYNGIDIAYYRNGYFYNDTEKHELYSILKEQNVQVLIIGMGTPNQEELAVFLKEKGLKAYIFTCGGFIAQTALRVDYYNKFKKNRFRWLQRAMEFKHIRTRLLFHYPINTFRYIIDHILLFFHSIGNKNTYI